MSFKMSPIGKKKCPYSPMQKKGLINPPNNAEQKAKDAGFNNFDEYFKDKYGKETAEKIAQGPYPKGRSFEAGGSGDFVSSAGSTMEVAGRRGTSREFISGMANYDKSEYINDRGEMLKKFTPKSNLKNAKPKYYVQKQGGESTTQEITRDQYRDMLSKGTTGGKFRRPEEEDIGTGGASLAELDLF